VHRTEPIPPELPRRSPPMAVAHRTAHFAISALIVLQPCLRWIIWATFHAFSAGSS
jgi:hypothetical protein